MRRADKLINLILSMKNDCLDILDRLMFYVIYLRINADIS